MSRCGGRRLTTVKHVRDVLAGKHTVDVLFRRFDGRDMTVEMSKTDVWKLFEGLPEDSRRLMYGTRPDNPIYGDFGYVTHYTVGPSELQIFVNL